MGASLKVLEEHELELAPVSDLLGEEEGLSLIHI